MTQLYKKQIGEVVVGTDEAVTTCPVMCNYSYGITCREIGTTNGHIFTVATRMFQRWQYGCFGLRLNSVDWDFGRGLDALFRELVRLWEATEAKDIKKGIEK